MRQTSIESFHRIKENGVLTKMELMVYEAIFSIGPATIKEICVNLAPVPETSISPIFARLERKGTIKTVSKRKCKITGNMVLEWDCTSGVPADAKPVRPATYNELKKFVVDEYHYLQTACDANSDNFAAYHGLRDAWKTKLTKMRILE